MTIQEHQPNGSVKVTDLQSLHQIPFLQIAIDNLNTATLLHRSPQQIQELYDQIYQLNPGIPTPALIASPTTSPGSRFLRTAFRSNHNAQKKAPISTENIERFLQFVMNHSELMKLAPVVEFFQANQQHQLPAGNQLLSDATLNNKSLQSGVVVLEDHYVVKSPHLQPQQLNEIDLIRQRQQPYTFQQAESITSTKHSLDTLAEVASSMAVSENPPVPSGRMFPALLPTLYEETEDVLTNPSSDNQPHSLKSTMDKDQRASAQPSTPQLFTHKRSLDDYHLVKVLGKGCMGKVLLAKDKCSNRIFAIKAISKLWVASHGQQEIEHTKAEQRILASLSAINHPFLMKLHCSFQNTENLFLVLDYIAGGDLATQLGKWHRFCENRSRFYAAEMVEGVRELHRLGIIYRDLKPENVLLEPSGHIKLTDFGLSKQFKISQKFNEREFDCNGEPRTRTFCGTAEYLAPEILQEKPYSFEVDWWSLGTFLFEMLSGVTPFWAENHVVMYRRILEDRLEFPPDLIGSDAMDLISKMLNRDPTQRLGYGGHNGAQSIISHPFFGSIDWNDLYHKRIRPPYIPAVRGETDFSNFDEEFTKMTPCLSPVTVRHHSAECGTGKCACTVLPESLQEQFQGYTFVSSSAGQMMASHLHRTAAADEVNAGAIPISSPSSQDWFRYAMKRRRSLTNNHLIHSMSPMKPSSFGLASGNSNFPEINDLSTSWQRGRKARLEMDTLDDILEFAMDDV